MRFNDLLKTIFASEARGPVGTVTRWRQCIDMLAQYDVSGAAQGYALGEAEKADITGMIETIRASIPLETRIASIADLGARLRSPSLVRVLAQDHPSVVSTMLAHAQLTDADWAAVIPMLGPLARSILRRRGDMEAQARIALDRFGSIDMSLPTLAQAAPVDRESVDDAEPVDTLDLETEATAAVDEDVEAEAEAAPHVLTAVAPVGGDPAPSQIRRIVERIERYTTERPPLRSEAPAMAAPTMAATAMQYVPYAQVEVFSFTTDVSGQIVDVMGAPRAAAIGLSIGQFSPDRRTGPDGQALGAHRRRAAFADARFTIGEGALSGSWRIAGDPRFDRGTGRFQGYAGSARRERTQEQIVQSLPVLEPVPAGTREETGGLTAASARQLIHELRTPLNAIQGYAELIDGQFMGPVSEAYRALARKIIDDARVLGATFDDLDLASRIARGDDRAQARPIDFAALVQGAVAHVRAEGGAAIDLSVAEDLPQVMMDDGQAERMIMHLLRAFGAVARPGESLDMALRQSGDEGQVLLALRLPQALAGRDESGLIEQASQIDQETADGPPLGMAFTLRLVRSIASRAGGRLSVVADRLEIGLPAAHALPDGQEQGSQI